MAHDICYQHFYIPSELQSLVAMLFGLRSLSAGSPVQEMMSTRTARGQIVRSYLVIFTHFIAEKIVSQTSNLMNLINNVPTTYVIFLSHINVFLPM